MAQAREIKQYAYKSDTSTPENSENDEWFDKEEKLDEVRRQLKSSITTTKDTGIKKWEECLFERHKLFFHVKNELTANNKASDSLIGNLANDKYYQSSFPTKKAKSK